MRKIERINMLVRSLRYSFRLALKSSRYFLFLYMILFLFNVSLPLLSSFSLKLLIDSLSVNNAEIEVVLSYILLYISILIIMHVINSGISFLFQDIVKRGKHQYGCDLITNLDCLAMSFLDSSEGKDQIDDVSTTDDIAVKFSLDFIKIVSVIYSFVVSYIILAGYSLLFSTIHIIITMPSIILNAYFNDKMAWLRYKMAPDARRFSYYRWMLTDVAPAKDVRTYDLTAPLKDRYQKEKSVYIEKNKAIDKRKCITLLFAELLRRFGEVLFTVFVVYDAISGTISIGDVVLYISLAIGATESFGSAFDLCVEYYLVRLNFMRRYFTFTQIVEENQKREQTSFRMLGSFQSLTFDNVYFKYPHTEKYVLSGVSFTLNKGDKLSIVGINGSGKSTIVKLMLGLYEIESGEIWINGYPMSDYDIRDVRKLFSALFQSYVQYPLSLRENVALSSLERIDNDKEIEDALTQSGVYEELQPKLESGLDSYMTRKFDDKGTELSKGQWQKIALSRAYFKNAPIIIFDEPSAALDAEAEDRIFCNFEEISEGKTGIMISHRISSARLSNKVIVLDGGKITETGTHDELVALDGLYAKLYNLQREKYTAKEEA